MKSIVLRIIAVLLLVFVTCGAFACADVNQQTDFLAAFYVAGCMVKEGKTTDLYPDQNQTSFAQAPFDRCAHQILPHLAANAKPFFQYPPLIALLFEPFSHLSPQTAFIVWQVLSLLALLLCSALMASLNGGNYLAYFWDSLLYLPIIHTLFIGQIGLIILCLPLALGYYYYAKEKPVKAGLAWSLLLLKPQFIAVPVFFIAAFTRSKKLSCLASFIVGMLVVSLSSIFCFGPVVANKWLSSLKLDAEIWRDPTCQHKTFLISSLHEAITTLFPAHWQPALDFVIYLLAMIIFLQALFFCRQLVKRMPMNNTGVMSLIFVLGILILPLILPYLRYYDLSIFAIAGMIVFENPVLKSNQSLRRELLLLWFLVDLYILIVLFMHNLAQPLFLTTTVIWAYSRVLKIICQPKLLSKSLS